MKALVYMGANTLKYKDYEEKDLEKDEVKIKVEATGICGSDLHAFLGHDDRRVPPMVLGHEVFGKVIEGEQRGTHVAINPIISCGKCDFCRRGRDNLCPNRKMLGMNKQGGFAEHLNVNKRNIIPVDSAIEIKVGALSEPLATAVHSLSLIEKSAFKSIKEMKALVIGAGSVGLLCGILLKHRGCKDVSVLEKNINRLQNIKNIEGIQELSNLSLSDSFDIIIDAVGIEPTRLASINHIEVGGIIMHIGLGDSKGTIDFRKITLAEITFIGTYAYTSRDFIDAAKLLESKQIERDLDWVEIRSLKDGQRAFEDIVSGNVSSAKIILTN